MLAPNMSMSFVIVAAIANAFKIVSMIADNLTRIFVVILMA